MISCNVYHLQVKLVKIKIASVPDGINLVIVLIKDTAVMSRPTARKAVDFVNYQKTELLSIMLDLTIK